MDSSELFGSLTTDRRASIGLIGFGRWGQTIARSLDNNKNCKLSAIVSHYPVASDQLPKDCTVYSTSVEMYQKHSISAVIIANSPKDHYQEALLALENNLPTWIEKPLTANPEESLDLLAVATRLNSRVFVDHIFVHSFGWSIFKSASHDMGKLIRVQSKGGAPLPIRDSISPLWDWGPHDISLVLDLVGLKPLSISAGLQANTASDKKTTFNTKLDIKFPGGILTSSIFGNSFSEKTRELKAHFEFGQLEILNFDDGPILKIQNHLMHKQKVTEIPIPRVPRPLDAAITKFLELIADTDVDLGDLRLGHDVVSILGEAEHQIFTQPFLQSIPTINTVEE
jgi:predicted dehydrogenase